MKFLSNPFLIFLLGLTSLTAQRSYEAVARSIGISSMDEFREFLSLPNDASNPDQITANISWVKAQLQALDFEVNMLETSSLPLLLANLKVKKGTPTIALYMHLDGQAVDGSQWNQENPYQAVLKVKREMQRMRR